MLPREFLWTDVYFMSDFLQNPLNQELYGLYKGLKNDLYRITMPDVKVFNEVYYLCISLYNRDILPSELKDKILADLGHQYAPDLIVSLIFTIFVLQKEKTEEQMALINHVLAYNYQKGWFFGYFYDFVKKHQSVTYQTNFSPRPLSPEDIIEKRHDWGKMTAQYSRENISRILGLWKEDKDKLSILNAIEQSFNNRIEPVANTSSNFNGILTTTLYPITKEDFEWMRDKIKKHRGLSSPVETEAKISNFESYIVDKEKSKKIIEELHKYIDGKKKPQLATLPIRAAIDAKRIIKPTWEVYHKEFPNCTNSRTSFEKYSGASFDVNTGFRGKEIYLEMKASFESL